MKNKYYRELKGKYGKSVYDMFKHFVSVKIFVNEGKEYSYDKTIIAYPHYKLDFTKENLETFEMIDIISGEKYSLKSDVSVGEKCFTLDHISKIDEDLFNREYQKNEEGRSTITYDVTNFDKTIKQMKNFILTTHGTSRLEEFKRLEFTPEEIELKEKKIYILENDSTLSSINIANTCYVSRTDKPLSGSMRKSKIKFLLSKTNVPVLIRDDKAIDLLDGETEYDILQYTVTGKRFSKKIELIDDQYNQIYQDLLKGNIKEYIDGYANINRLGYDSVFNFSIDELKTITDNAKKILAKEKQKKLVK